MQHTCIFLGCQYWGLEQWWFDSYLIKRLNGTYVFSYQMGLIYLNKLRFNEEKAHHAFFAS